MNRSAHYKTKQREELCAYLATLHGQHVTVNDIALHFAAQGSAIGTTTIYRHLEKMVEEGVAKKYMVDGVSGACFEYIGEGEEHCGPQCYHLKCEKCGRLIHFQCDEMEHIQTHLLEEHGFQVNSLKTVFYGVCSQCAASV